MSHRQFVDAEGSVWAVWDVHPSLIWQSLGAPAPPSEALRARTGGPLDRALADGWLCFESDGRKLRLAPIPEQWEILPNEALATLCKVATAVQRPPRERQRSTGSDSSEVRT